MKIRYLAYILLCISKVQALEIYTTHPQVAYSLDHLGELYQVDLKGKNLFNMAANVHDFEPTAKDMRKLKTHSPLIAGPTAHQPWIKKAHKINLLPKQSFLLDIFPSDDDHFWLSSKQACLFEERTLNALREWKLIDKQNKKLLCQWTIDQEKDLLSSLKEKKIKKIILTHSALKSALIKIPNLEVLILIEGDHHHEVSGKTLKKAYSWLMKGDEVLVVQETGFPFPKALNPKETRLINWNPMYPKPQPLKSLVQLVRSLK